MHFFNKSLFLHVEISDVPLKEVQRHAYQL